MDHYVDIDVQPDPEFPAHQLMEALYAKLHRALMAHNSTSIGVSFPGFSQSVANKVDNAAKSPCRRSRVPKYGPFKLKPGKLTPMLVLLCATSARCSLA